MLKRLIAGALVALAALSSHATAQSWKQLQWGLNTADSPYQVGVNLSGSWYRFATVTPGGAFSLSDVSIPASSITSGTLAAARLPAFSGDVTTPLGSSATTLATVNGNVGSFGSTTQTPQVTVDAKGRVTAVANVTVTPAVGSITGLGSGVATALGNAAGAANGVATLDSAGMIASAQLRTPGFRNRLRNASFAINQRQVSGTVTLAAGAYGHDGVKGGASGATYTFATSGIDTTITISAGSLILPIEDKLIEGGVYRLSQAGNAQARVWQGTGSTGSGSYAAAPFTTASLTANTQTNVEFSTGTILRPQLEAGSTETAFERRPYGAELLICQRYFNLMYLPSGAFVDQYAGGPQNILFNLSYPEMRVAPTGTLVDTAASNGATAIIYAMPAIANLSWTAGAAGRIYVLNSTGTAYISLSAEI